MRTVYLLPFVIALVSAPGCRERGESIPDVSVLDSAVTARGEKIYPAPERDIVGPTVVAFYPLSTVYGVSSHDSPKGFADLDHQINEAGGALDSLGVRFYFQYSGTVKYRIQNVAEEWHAPSDSIKVGYVFLAPGRALDVRFGMLSNADLIRQTRNWLRKAANVSR